MRKDAYLEGEACDRDDEIIDLGAASEATQGVPGLFEEFEGRIPLAGIAD